VQESFYEGLYGMVCLKSRMLALAVKVLVIQEVVIVKLHRVRPEGDHQVEEWVLAVLA